MAEKHVDVVPYQDDWKIGYEKESGRIAKVFAEMIAAIHHIGSTAIPGMSAKPTIDILVEVSSLHDVDLKDGDMERLGYVAMGEYGISGRRYYFKKNDSGEHLFHIHLFEQGTQDVVRHLAFRDYLISHKEDAVFYSELKEGLAQSFPSDIDSYQAGKNAAAKRIEALALEWWYAS